MTHTLVAAAVLGLLGSAHCAGMCGGFYLMSGRNLRAGQLPYIAGKTTTYAVLGAIIGGIGAGVAVFMGARNTLAVLVGVALILAGLTWVGVLPRFWTGSPVARMVARAISRTLERTGPLAPFLLGLANGFLPCGLLYGALGIAATTASMTGGAAAMLVFGLATIPGLALFGVLARKIGGPLVRNTHLLGGLAMIVFGVVTVMRALMLHGHSMQ